MVDVRQQVMWTALPKEIGRKGPVVSVVVSPRLFVDGAGAAALKSFPAWLDWPKVLSNAGFTVQFGRQRVRASLASKVDPEMWRAVFRDDLLVFNHRYQDLSKRRLISYSIRDMERRLIDAYVKFAGAGTVLPEGGPLLGHLRDFNTAPSGPDLLKTLANEGGENFLKELRSAGVEDLGRFHGYHAPVSEEPGPPPNQNDLGVLIKGIDFHKMVALLGQYKMLMRGCGLIFDLALAKPLEDGSGNLSVSVAWKDPGGTKTGKDIFPLLSVQLKGKRFEALPKTQPIVGRRLDLSDKRYHPVQVDVDGGIIKVTGTAETLANRQGRINAEGETARPLPATGLPTLRTAGILLAEEARGKALGDRLAKSTKLNTVAENGKPVTLFAEDVVRGYHIDIGVGKEWYSLCRTDIRYSFERTGKALIDKDVEGIVQLGGTEAAPGAPPEMRNFMKLSEGLFQWDGWSLAAARPGLAIDTNEAPRADQSGGMLPVSADQRAHPGSLPTLRFGTTYMIRARLADLAHNAEPYLARDGAASSRPVTFRRFEPLAPPAPSLVRHGGAVDAPEAGASLLRMVIRSGDAEAGQPTSDQDWRMMFPPRSSLEMAERHGVLDDANGRPQVSMYETLAIRDNDLEELTAGPESERRKYPVTDAGAAIAPWLPDPMADRTRVSLDPSVPRYEDGSRTEQMRTRERRDIEASQPWPNYRPFMLRLHEGQGDPLGFVAHQGVPFSLSTRVAFDADSHMLSIALPKGETLRATVSQVLEGKSDPADLWGVAAWLRDRMKPDAYEKLTHAINGGEHWAFTPSLQIEMIHAVQRPLVQPAPVFAPVARLRGETDAGIEATSPCHAESTEEVTLDGAWIEINDDGRSASLDVGWRSSRALRKTLVPTETPLGQITLSGRHAFSDTCYRRVSYTLTGTSRFAEFFPPAIRGDRDAITSASEDVVVHVPNASPPPPPKIVRTAPVFDWLRDVSGNYKASWRRSGLRVYLERPWFDTGFGEMLAAILPRPNLGNAAMEQVARHVSMWGGDPIWRSHGSAGRVASTAPPMSAFPSRALPSDGPDERWPDLVPEPERDLSGGNPDFTNLSLPDENGAVVAQVDAAGHPVSWDAEAKQFYADLMMDTGRAYQPFVSLSVARLHPISVPGCHLSPPIRLEPLQVLPERLVLARKNSSGWAIHLYGHPHGVRADQSGAGVDHPKGSLVRVEVQRATRSNPDDLDWETIEDTALADAPDVQEVNPDAPPILPASYRANALFNGMQGLLYDAADRFTLERPKRLYYKRMRTPGAGGGDPGSHSWRIRVTEWERHARDGSIGNLSTIPHANERLIFAETFQII